MPNPLTAVLLAGTTYNDTTSSILDVFGGRGGFYNIRNGPVFVQIEYGVQGQTSLGAEFPLQPGTGSIEPGTIGIRFRNQSTSTPATVDARITPAGQPNVTPTSTGTVSSSLIAGVVKSDGTVISGSGFTVVRNAAGTYTITFTTAFTNVPGFVSTPDDGNLAASKANYQNLGTGSVQVITRNASNTISDANFSFVAAAVL